MFSSLRRLWPFHASLRRRSAQRARTALLWLLAAVVPLQGGAAFVRAAAGPAHVHLAPSAPAFAAPLLDVRRIGPSSRAADRSAVAGLSLATLVHGHTHAERHRHFGGDAGVAVPGEAALDRADAGDDGGASGAATLAWLPLPVAAAAWQGSGAAHRLPVSRGWAASWQVGTPLERPPRGTAAA